MVTGRFLGIDAATEEQLRSGAKTPGEAWLEVVRLEAPVADRRAISIGGGPYVPAFVEERMQVPATLRVRCTLTGTTCRTGDRSFSPGTELALPIGGVRAAFVVDYVEGAGTTVLTPGKTVDVLAKFLMLPDMARLIRAGDRDLHVETAPAPIAAQVVRIEKARTVHGQTVLEAPYAIQRFASSTSLIDVDLVLRVPAAIDGTSTYRGHRMAPGAPLVFETERYVVSGQVIKLLGESGARP
jgi:hypothetical protein